METSLTRGELLHLLSQYKAQADDSAVAHEMAFRRAKHNISKLTVVTAVIPFIASSILIPALIQTEVGDVLEVISMVLSASASLLVVFGNACGWKDDLKQHENAFLRFGELSREVTFFIIMPHTVSELTTFVDLCEHKYAVCEMMASNIPTEIANTLVLKFSDENERERLIQNTMLSQAAVINKMGKTVLSEISNMSKDELYQAIEVQECDIKPSSTYVTKKRIALQTRKPITSERELLESILFDHKLHFNSPRNFKKSTKSSAGLTVRYQQPHSVLSSDNIEDIADAVGIKRTPTMVTTRVQLEAQKEFPDFELG
jgi:hypothetical protein